MNALKLPGEIESLSQKDHFDAINRARVTQNIFRRCKEEQYPRAGSQGFPNNQVCEKER